MWHIASNFLSVLLVQYILCILYFVSHETGSRFLKVEHFFKDQLGGQFFWVIILTIAPLSRTPENILLFIFTGNLGLWSRTKVCQNIHFFFPPITFGSSSVANISSSDILFTLGSGSTNCPGKGCPPLLLGKTGPPFIWGPPPRGLWTCFSGCKSLPCLSVVEQLSLVQCLPLPHFL